MAPTSLRSVFSFWKKERTRFGSSSPTSPAMMSVSGLGRMDSSHGCRLKEGNWEPSKFSETVRVKYSDLELDALQWSGQGAFSSIPGATTLPGSGEATRGRLTFKRVRAKADRGLYLTYLFLALGPLLGCLLTLLTLASLSPSITTLQESSLQNHE